MAGNITPRPLTCSTSSVSLPATLPSFLPPLLLLPPWTSRPPSKRISYPPPSVTMEPICKPIASSIIQDLQCATSPVFPKGSDAQILIVSHSSTPLRSSLDVYQYLLDNPKEIDRLLSVADQVRGDETFTLYATHPALLQPISLAKNMTAQGLRSEISCMKAVFTQMYPL